MCVHGVLLPEYNFLLYALFHALHARNLFAQIVDKEDITFATGVFIVKCQDTSPKTVQKRNEIISDSSCSNCAEIIKTRCYKKVNNKSKKQLGWSGLKGNNEV